MHIYTRTTKVLSVERHELDMVSDMLNEARTKGRAERLCDRNMFLAIEVREESGSPRSASPLRK